MKQKEDMYDMEIDIKNIANKLNINIENLIKSNKDSKDIIYKECLKDLEKIYLLKNNCLIKGE